MDKAEELRIILRKLPDIYRSGDIEGYSAYYSPDLSANHSGLVMNSDETRKFLKSLLKGTERRFISRLVNFKCSSMRAMTLQ